MINKDIYSLSFEFLDKLNNSHSEFKMDSYRSSTDRAIYEKFFVCMFIPYWNKIHPDKKLDYDIAAHFHYQEPVSSCMSL